MKKASSQLNRKPLVWQEAFFMKKASSQLNTPVLTRTQGKIESKLKVVLEPWILL